MFTDIFSSRYFIDVLGLGYLWIFCRYLGPGMWAACSAAEMLTHGPVRERPADTFFFR